FWAWLNKVGVPLFSASVFLKSSLTPISTGQHAPRYADPAHGRPKTKWVSFGFVFALLITAPTGETLVGVVISGPG
ncbi:hypothetical protein, partial [Aromatoleum bremense]|uniref:hypothetical protein n=1 Tax=Aromatoleum bremense TaxID=76115 RepID=UPI001B7D0A8F